VKFKTWMLAAALAAMTSSANAAVITWTYDSTITMATGPLFHLGDTVQVSVTMDTSVVPYTNVPTVLASHAVLSVSFGSSTATQGGNLAIFNNSGVGSPIVWEDRFAASANLTLPNGLPLGALFLLFLDQGPSPANLTALTSTAIPLSPLDPASFDTAKASYFMPRPGGAFEQYEASLNAISAVPEPSTWAMMILGFGVVGLVAYRRSKKQVAAAA
jgi:hypothetical protein